MRHFIPVLTFVCFSPLAYAEDKALTPAEAVKKVGEVCTVEFKVVAIGVPKSGAARQLLSSDEPSAKDSIIVGLTDEALDQLKTQLKTTSRELGKLLKGKTVRATGKVVKREAKRGDEYEILIADVKHLTIVEKK